MSEDLISPDLLEQVRAQSRNGRPPAVAHPPDERGVAGVRAWLSRAGVTDLSIHGLPHAVYTRVRLVDGRWFTVEPLAATAEEVEVIARQLAREAGHLDDASHGEMDVSLPEGRMHVALGLCGPAMPIQVSIRSLMYGPRSLDELVEAHMLTPELAQFLRDAVVGHVNILISGAQKAGKTTLARCLGREVPSDEQLVTIEDTFELGLHLQRPASVVPLLARPPNVDGQGEIPMASLARAALRMGADRVWVGEVRGAEALYMIRAFSSGTEGSVGTIHARSAAAAPDRLVDYAAQGEWARDRVQLAKDVGEALHLAVHLDLHPFQHVVEVAEVTGYGEGTIQTSPLWQTDGRPPAARTNVRASAQLARRLGARW